MMTIHELICHLLILFSFFTDFPSLLYQCLFLTLILLQTIFPRKRSLYVIVSLLLEVKKSLPVEKMAYRKDEMDLRLFDNALKVHFF